MAPKLLNRFRVKVKTEPADNGDSPAAAGTPGRAGDAVPLPHMSQVGDDTPISAFQQQRYELEQQQSAAATPSQAATTAAAAAAAGSHRAAPGVRGNATGQAARRAQQNAEATAHARQVTGATGAGASMASESLEVLRRLPATTPPPEGLIPPITSADLHRAAEAAAKAEGTRPTRTKPEVKSEADDDDDVADAPAAPEVAPVAVDAGVSFLLESEREAARVRTANEAFFVDENGSARTFENAEIAWMQLPRMPAAPKLGAALPAQPPRSLLESLPAGRVGRLRVHKSGRVSMVFDAVPAGTAPDVAFDVSAGRADGGGMAQNLMAIEQLGEGSADLRCYDL
eukprot:CAMPEP_0174869866 /NCGR_PEP_ID=MMETSP1114-20130205/68649_1 /TAXON_ID=312471 /ORGANISM="Neobodo designis, Strain CCAP 1951/1" /LENGTH=341 /DNA_ID=CAMNT_0016105125 /DNA_START=26 /DNA_END=1048 /DNA_ORIENTATION=+